MKKSASKVWLLTIILASVFVALPANASTYTYDNLNRLTSVTYDNGQKVIYTYDVAGNILEVQYSGFEEPSETWTDFTPTVQKTSNESWTITFNQDVDPQTVNPNNIYVATDDSGNNKVIGITVTPVNGNPRQVKVAPPTNGWQAGETYFLFISKRVQSSTAYGCQALKNGVRMRFNISSYNNDVVL
ncbi:MAG: RHS repeat protein [Syntrophomonadaceae bacterium]|nr:RHS repeat protein [Syntrophomonadaceae bacterium]